MKQLKKIMGMSMALLMGASTVAGCGTKGVTMPEEPADIAKLATERTNELKSYELNGTANVDAEFMGEKVKADMTIHAVYFKDPMKMKMDYEIAYGEEKMDYSYYFMKEDDTYVTYTCMEDEWTKQKLDPKDDSQKKMIEKLESGMFDMGAEYYDHYTIAEEQPKEDEKTLDFTMKAEELMDVIGQLGMDKETMKQAGLSEEMLKSLGDIKCVMGVDKENVYWKSVKMDMTQMVQGIFDYMIKMFSAFSEEKMTAKVSNCVMDMTYDKYNEAEDFTLPEEAKNAEEIDTSSLLGGADEETSLDLSEEEEKYKEASEDAKKELEEKASSKDKAETDDTSEDKTEQE